MPVQIAEQVSAYENQRKTAQDRMTALMVTAADAGRTLDEDEAKEYDGLESQTKSISEHVVRLQRLDATNKAAAVVVAGNGVDTAAASRDPATERRSSVVHMRPNVPIGTAFARYVIALAAGKGSRLEALQFAKSRKDWQSSTPEVVQLFEDDNAHYFMRAAVPAGTTYDSCRSISKSRARPPALRRIGSARRLRNRSHRWHSTRLRSRGRRPPGSVS
jgi:hypothetical protein